ncbi:MAG: flagellar filament capping protein FliD [Planctomycetota bacterium]|nr:flagellar filament capping protein FliD [Planctomycetota bacterium]
MGTITTGTGLISGIDTASLIDAYLAIDEAGKSSLQQRIATLQAEQTALMDINARLLNFKTASRAFRIDRIFQSALATSSNSEVLSGTASTSAEPGSFKFIVKQLVSTSQQITQGYASTDADPLGLDNISFEFGNGRLSRQTALEDLNGGAGIDRGSIIINDRAGNSATIDLTDVTSVDEVLERINDEEDISVTASVDGDHLVITDTSGGAGTLTVTNASGDTTATDLGIAGSAAGDTLTGSGVNYIGNNTALSTLNDGNGVLVRNNVNDLSITARDGVSFDVDLGRIDEDITDDTLLADLNNGEGITIDDDYDTADIRFTDRSGTEHEVDLSGLTTVGGLKTRIESETGGDITLEIVDGDHFKVVDNTGESSSYLKIQGTDDSGTDAAEDLGILNETGVDADEYEGEVVPSNIDSPAATTIEDVIERINNADGNGGRVVASIAADGLSLRIEDTTGSVLNNLIVTSTGSNPDAASDLGIDTGAGGVASATLNGDRLLGAIDSVLVKSLNGGDGLDGATTITISDRDNDEFTVVTLDTYESLSELMTFLNEEAAANGVDVEIGLNASGNGLLVTDTSGGTNNLTISGDGATALGLEADVADTTVQGTNLQLQYVSNAKKLSELNYGRGVGTGSFRITDGLGSSATVNIGGDERTLYDVVREINSKGLAVNARVNDNGDGLIIEEDLTGFPGETPFVAIKVETVSGTAAADLNILGESEDIEGGSIDGSYEASVDLTTSDTLAEVIEKINDASIPVSATLLNTGGGATPYRMSLTSSISGRAGELIIDTGGVDLGLSALSEGRDAKVFFGSDNPEDGFLVTSDSNTLDDVIEGVSIDLHKASDEAVTLTVSRDEESIVEAVKQFVTTFNDVVGRINDYDFFDVDTEEKGVLLGNGTTRTVSDALYRVVSGKALNLDTSFQYLSQVGIGINSSGELTFDQTAFREAYAEDPEAVENLFAAYDVTDSSSEELGDGISVDTSETTYNALGFGSLFDRLLEDLTDSFDGTMTRAQESYQDRIDLLENRIEAIDVKLEAKRERLTLEFANMERALAQLQSQANSLASLTSISASTNSLFGL